MNDNERITVNAEPGSRTLVPGGLGDILYERGGHQSTVVSITQLDDGSINVKIKDTDIADGTRDALLPLPQ